MKKYISLIALAAFAAVFSLALAIQMAAGQGGFEAVVLVDNLEAPWAIDFLPDGRMIFTERAGRVSIFDGTARTTVGQISVAQVSESGLLGIAVDDLFEKNNFIYLYYTYQEGGSLLNKVSRFVLDGALRSETVLLDRIPGAVFHDGGRIKFGPDGKLYIATGDAGDPALSQDTNSLAGKILRINKDGTVPGDNPFGNRVFSYGHRNPQGIAWNPATKVLYAAEHGPSSNDEVNIILKGWNYGWPTPCSEPSRFANPIRCFSEFTLAPSGIAFLGGDLYVAGLRGSQLRKLVLGDDRKTILGEEALFADLGRLRDVVERNGYLYIATNNRDGRGSPRPGDDKIIRMRFN